MEEENQTSITSKPFLPLAIGFAALAVGIAALAFAISASSRASTAEENFKSAKDSLDRIAQVSIEMKNLNTKMEQSAALIEDIKSASATNVDSLARKVQGALTSLNGEIEKNRALIAKNQEAISGGSRSRASSNTTQEASTSEPTAASGDSKKHNVRPNETLTVIAKKYGKTLSEIERANPGVDSRRMHVGQEIIIP